MENDDLSLSQLELIDRIGWLIRLRWLAFVGVAATILVARLAFDSSLPWLSLYVTACAIPCYNLVAYLDWRQVNRVGVEHIERISSRLANIQIVCDLVILGVLIHFSGGIENLFGFYFVFHMVIASILLSRRAAYAQATVALAIFAIMAIGEYFELLPHYDSPIGMVFPGMHVNGTSVLGAVWVMATALYGTVYLATSTASRLRFREDQVVTLLRKVSHNADMLQIAYDDLAGLDEAKRVYTRKVAHELRSPLAAVDSLLRVVADGLHGEVSPDAREMILRAKRRTRELLAVVGDLLILAAAEERLPSSRRKKIHIEQLIETVVGLHEEYARARSINVITDRRGDTPVICGDPEGLEQLLTNLVSNAIKYSHQGGTVTVRVGGADDRLRIVVSDTGIGIPDAEQERIFEEFYRSDEARKLTLDGTGLGLSIVRTIADAHGGTVDVESAVGVGTKFTVTLPLSGCAETALEGTPPPPSDCAG